MMILLTGGAACGKSYVAEQLVARFSGQRYYIATMRPFGVDGQEKIAKHRKMRQGKNFQTIECYGNLAALTLPQKNSVVLLECITNLVADELYDCNGMLQPIEQVQSRVLQGVQTLSEQCENVIIITNDVGSDGMLYEQETKDYVHLLGAINCILAAQCHVVIDMSCGIPFIVKGSLKGINNKEAKQGEVLVL